MTHDRLRLAFLADPNSVHSRRWMGFFAERGHEVRLLVDASWEVTPGMPVGVDLVRYAGFGRRLRPPGAFRARRSLRRALEQLRPQVLHAHYLVRYGWAGRLSGRHPFVATAWGSDALRLDRQPLVARLASRWTLRGADLVTAVSQDLAEAAVRAGARREVVRLVQFGVDGTRFHDGPDPVALREALGLQGRRIVFAPRSIRPLYRQSTLVEALAGLPPDVVLLMTRHGADAAALAGLQERAGQLDLTERVRLVPALSHELMPDHYRLADVVASVPESDAFPVTALEAMASGRPLLLSDLASAREGLAGVAEAGRRATRVVPVGDVAATREALAELLDLDREVRREAGPALRAAALERGDMARDLLRMEGYYRALATGQPVGP